MTRPFKKVDNSKPKEAGKKYVWLDQTKGLFLGLSRIRTTDAIPEDPLELSQHLLLLTKERMVLEAKLQDQSLIMKK